jgi:hypothetical protein
VNIYRSPHIILALFASILIAGTAIAVVLLLARAAGYI